MDKKISQSAFTLVELLLVIVMVGIVGAYAMDSYTKIQSKAQNRNMTVQLRALHSAAQVYKARHGDFGWNTMSSLGAIEYKYNFRFINSIPTDSNASLSGTNLNPSITISKSGCTTTLMLANPLGESNPVKTGSCQ